MEETRNPAVDRPHRSREPTRKKQPSLLKDVWYLLLKIAAIVAMFALLFTFMFGLTRYPDGSMAPAIRDGDLVMFYQLDKRYAAQDTVALVFEGRTQIRRVVATAGDTVDITERGLLVNGALQQEPWIYSPTQRYADGVEFPLTVPEECVFVLADARENATDSRIYGAVEIKDTLGKVMMILRRRNI